MPLGPVSMRPIDLRTIGVDALGFGPITLDAIALRGSLRRSRPFWPIAAWAFGLRQRSLDATAHDGLGSGMIRLGSAKGSAGHGEISTNPASNGLFPAALVAQLRPVVQPFANLAL